MKLWTYAEWWCETPIFLRCYIYLIYDMDIYDYFNDSYEKV